MLALDECHGDGAAAESHTPQPAFLTQPSTNKPSQNPLLSTVLKYDFGTPAVLLWRLKPT